MRKSREQAALFPEVSEKAAHVEFSESGATSVGGAVLLGALNRSLGLTDLFSDTTAKH